MLRVFAVLVMMLLASLPSHAETLNDNDRTAIQGIISQQIEAFRADDGARAYSHAAPMIRQIFRTPEHFMAMVKNGYPPVYRPQSFRFGAAGPDTAGRPTQRVDIVGPDGQNDEAIYTMEQQPDGTWQINGCALVKLPGLST